MTLEEALSKIHQPAGATSLIAALMPGGDLNSIASAESIEKNIDIVKEGLSDARLAQQAATSDAAYWGYVGQIAYLSALADILKAVAITGPDDLPYIPAPKTDGVLMDVCANIEGYGKSVLKAAKSTR